MMLAVYFIASGIGETIGGFAGNTEYGWARFDGAISSYWAYFAGFVARIWTLVSGSPPSE
jgi:hypothetical protein